MNTHLALLRAVNVGGTGKLPMARLRALAEGLGFTRVHTHIASGNLRFDSRLDATAARAQLEAGLSAELGKPATVVLRSPAELAALLAVNPFPDAAPNRVLLSLLNEALPADAAQQVRHQQGEQIVWGEREVWVHYGEGMGQSKLKLPAAEAGTARNLNTLHALLRLT